MSEMSDMNLACARELRAVIKAAEGWVGYVSADNVLSLIRQRANELDHPEPPLPTDFGWHPNVVVRCSRGCAPTYLPGALRTGAESQHWVVVTKWGTQTTCADEQVRVVES